MPQKTRLHLRFPAKAGVGMIAAQRSGIRMTSTRIGSSAPADRGVLFTISYSHDAKAQLANIPPDLAYLKDLEHVHLDLEDIPAKYQDGVKDIESSRDAVARTLAFIRKCDALKGTREVHLFAKVSPATLIALGSGMRRDGIRAYRQMGGLQAFGPVPSLGVPGMNPFHLLTLEPPLPGRGAVDPEVVLAVDLMGYARPDQLRDLYLSRTKDIDPGAPKKALHSGYILHGGKKPIITENNLPHFLLEILGTIDDLVQRGARRLYLAYAGPDFFAFLLGQQLNTLVPITLCEYHKNSDSYQIAFRLDGSEAPEVRAAKQSA
ncbi:MAG: SAVED domain-containing protein [Polyangiaceae bacterium]|nr:SAVED domain-containing protein [Polyangiaceae bacterium]